MSTLVSPHGFASLRPLLLEGAKLDAERARATSLPAIQISSREAGDVVMMGIGGFTPLAGFMGHDNWRGVCDHMRMTDGVFWPIPITLSVDSTTAEGIDDGNAVALIDPETGQPLATMTVAEKYRIDKAHECRSVFKTTDVGHPGVRMVMDQGDVNLAGPIRVLSTSYFGEEFGRLFLTPAQTRAMFQERGWSKVAAFQTRNPMHRSHEYLAKIGIEVGDGVLIHSLLGRLKPGDIPAGVRARAIDVLLEHYFVENTVIHAGYPLDMRYAGPREALLHALFRQNYGCSEQLVGRDHAGSMPIIFLTKLPRTRSRSSR
jgi:sulfate adenylyltransferase